MDHRIAHGTCALQSSGAEDARGRPNTDTRTKARSCGKGLDSPSLGKIHETRAKVRGPRKGLLGAHAPRVGALKGDGEVAKLEAVVVAKRSFVEVSPAAARGVKALNRVSGVRRKRMNESAKRRDMVIVDKRGREQSSLRGEVLRLPKQTPRSPSVPYR